MAIKSLSIRIDREMLDIRATPVGADDSVRPIGERKHFRHMACTQSLPCVRGGVAAGDGGVDLRWCGGNLLDATAA